MFKVVENHEFTANVSVMTPIDGGHREDKFRARFAMQPVDVVDSFDLDEGTAASTAFLQRIVVGLEDVVGEDDQPIPYSDELRDKLLQWPHVRFALTMAYFGALVKARAGN